VRLELLDEGRDVARGGDRHPRGLRGRFERFAERGRRGVAIVRRALERALAHGLDRLGDGRIEVLHAAPLGAEDLRQQLGVVLAADEALAREHLPQDRARRVDVGAPVDRRALDLLLRHVRQFALDLGAPGRREPRLRVGNAEVREASHAVDADEDVVRRDVAMDEIERLAVRSGELVCGVQSSQSVEEDPQREVERQRPPRAPERAQHRLERRPLDVFHDQEEPLFVLLDVEGGDHVGVTDARREAGLVEEHVDEVGLGGEVRVHRLDGDEPLEAARAESAAETHLGHPARGDDADDLVAAATQGH
jgi:hypothetical protein